MNVAEMDSEDEQSAMTDDASATSDLSFTFCSRRLFDHNAKRMQKFYEEQLFCDVCLVVEGRRINAHRLVLAAASDYFSALFTSSMRESGAHEVQMLNIGAGILETLVLYCYYGEILLTESRVEELLDVASQLQLAEVVEACSDFLKQRLHPSNSLGIRSFAESHGCTILFEAAQNYVINNFMEVMNQQEFLMLSAEDVYNLLSCDDINVGGERDIFDAITMWMAHDLPERKVHFELLLSALRMPLLSPSFIARRIESHPLLSENQQCYQFILEAYRFHLIPEQRHQLRLGKRGRPRKSTVGTVYCLGGMDSNKGAQAIECYNFLKNEWNAVACMPRRRLQFGVAHLDDKIFVIGGRDGLKTLATVECWDYRRDDWTHSVSMNTARHGLGVCVLNGIIYAIGGHDGWTCLASVERFDGRSWVVIADMFVPRSSCGVAVLDGKIYVVGGRDISGCHKSVECYDPCTHRWTMCADMHKPRGSVGVGVLNGCIYALGGTDSSAGSHHAKRFSSVERYDPSTNQWTLVAELAMGKDGIAVCTLGTYLLAAGGFNGLQYEERVEYYNEAEDEWFEAKSLCVGRAGACLAVVPTQEGLA
uniref:BTB domain-containing protein n=1 Tax=Trichuris muris TaxID=70415 RepID=A0A5S6QG65_TRIMR